MLYGETYNEYNETGTPDEYTKVYTVVTPGYWTEIEGVMTRIPPVLS